MTTHLGIDPGASKRKEHSVVKFDFTSYNDEAFKKAWALNNLQPLWADENLKKGAKWRWY